MTLKIEVFVPEEFVLNERAPQYLANALAAIGYAPIVGRSPVQRDHNTGEPLVLDVDGFLRDTKIVAEAPEVEQIKKAEIEPAVEKQPAADTISASPQRERGKPSLGAKRRTKEEVAEDLAFEAAQNANSPEMQQAVSTGEERINPEDSAEDQAQDKADEQAEAEASRDPKAPLTVDDVRGAMNAYLEKFGLPATQEDGAKIMSKAFGAPPAGEKAWRVSLLTEQDQFAKAIEYWSAALTENPFKRAEV